MDRASRFIAGEGHFLQRKLGKPEALRVGNENLHPSDSIFAPRLACFPCSKCKEVSCNENDRPDDDAYLQTKTSIPD